MHLFVSLQAFLLKYFIKMKHCQNKHEEIIKKKTEIMNEKVELKIKDSPMKVPEGAKLIGNYILGKSIGQGTFGKVHLGMHIQTNEKVAVKIIEKSKIAQSQIHRVKAEIKILSKTRHQHLIHLYEIIQTEKSLLLIMEFMPNGELFKQIIKQKKFQENDACRMFHQILSGVEYLHTNGIAHRDLKPENIMIDYDNQLKIIDFGLSSFYQKNQHLKSFCGSPCYAAPEMIESKKSYNPLQVDIWSCGIILYVMLCGKLPFCDLDTKVLYKKILSGVFKIPEYVSSSAKDLIERMLVLNPSSRCTIQQIKKHQWFNLNAIEKTNGINLNQRLKLEGEVCRKTVQLGFNQSKIMEGMEKNEKNKETGAYYLCMKKLVKNGLQLFSYIGDHKNFDRNFIERVNRLDFLSGEESTCMDQVLGVEGPSTEDVPKNTDQSNPSASQWWAEQGTKHTEHHPETLHIENIISKIYKENINSNPINFIKRRFLTINKRENVFQNRFHSERLHFYMNNNSIRRACTKFHSEEQLFVEKTIPLKNSFDIKSIFVNTNCQRKGKINLKSMNEKRRLIPSKKKLTLLNSEDLSLRNKESEHFKRQKRSMEILKLLPYLNDKMQRNLLLNHSKQ